MALTVLLLATSAAAGTPAPGTPSAIARSEVPDEKLAQRLRAARIQRNIGWGLAGVGIAALVAGAGTIAFGFHDERGFSQGVIDVIAGGATVAAGLALALPGVVLAMRGQEGITEVLWLRAFVAPGASGVSSGVLLVF